MESEKVIVIQVQEVVADTVYGKELRRVTDTQGNVYNIKQGQGGKLKAKWNLLKEGASVKLHFGTFRKDGTDYSYVRDIEVVAESSIVPVKSNYKGKSQEELELSRLSYGMSYMKDIVCQGKEAVELLYASERLAVVRLRKQLEMILGQGVEPFPAKEAVESITPEQEKILLSFPKDRLAELLKERGITKPTKQQANSLIDQLEMEREEH